MHQVAKVLELQLHLDKHMCREGAGGDVKGPPGGRGGGGDAVHPSVEEETPGKRTSSAGDTLKGR